MEMWSTRQFSDFDLKYGIGPAKHLYQFYKNKEDFLRVVIPFLGAGLEKGEGCLWIVSENMGIESVSKIAEKEIARFSFYALSGQLQIVSGEDWYLKDGRFDEGQAISNSLMAVKKMEASGFFRMRITGDAGAIPHDEWKFLRQYEEKVDSYVKAGPLVVLCTFPILECDLKDTKMVLDCHDDVLVGKL